MAVFTELTSHEVEAFVARLHAGELIELAPIGAGIENTNYFVTTSAAIGCSPCSSGCRASSCRSTCA